MTSQQENSQIESAIDRRLFLGAAGALTLAGQSALAQETKAEARPVDAAKRLSDTIADFVLHELHGTTPLEQLGSLAGDRGRMQTDMREAVRPSG